MNRPDAKDDRVRSEPVAKLDALTTSVLEAAGEVHRVLGPGFFEGVYAEALAFELRARHVAFEAKPALALRYKGRRIGEIRPDFIVAGLLVLGLETVNELCTLHAAAGDLVSARDEVARGATRQRQRRRLLRWRAARDPLG